MVVLVALFLIAVGIAEAVAPEAMWRLSKWQYRDPDAVAPSDAAFALWRVGGVLTIAFGIGILVLLRRTG